MLMNSVTSMHVFHFNTFTRHGSNYNYLTSLKCHVLEIKVKCKDHMVLFKSFNSGCSVGSPAGL